MLHETHHQESQSHWAGPQHQRPRTGAEILSNLTKWYGEGRPLLTKDALRNVQKQLRSPLQGVDKVWTIGFDGAKVEWEAWGKPYGVPEEEEAAYCSMTVSYLLGLKDMVTKVPVVYPSYTVDESRAVLQQSIRTWEESETWSHLKKTLIPILSRHHVNKIVGFSCFSLSWPQEESEDIRSGIQHALLLTVRSLLERTTAEHNVPCYVQDPAYNDVDKEVLQEQGMQFVNDPQGFLEVDESSVVFSCASNIAVKEIVTELARPAVIIWDKVEERKIETGDELGDDFYPSTDPATPRVFDMLSNSYDTYTFLPDTNFGNMAVYVRK
ncbi:hypothetical protein BO78DRAFT_378764 [Aspergillus sclerotiicarbonarius CBS 121057]|uniref:SRR1-like domain-containing protein n=1 Tax=Aspergillus sclerotiicarbonarius (strain CBS 121057 / IBT 28362) TaxID=1448318 RepID=A0A319F7S4_ASPSB|nr:hypothetical protein BO78DRAFT_378764 [Aspergillus sclerotiicarbonarius CBS 121057]